MALGSVIESMRIKLKGFYYNLEHQVLVRTRELSNSTKASQAEVAERKRMAKENMVLAEIGKITSSKLDLGQTYELLCQEASKLLLFNPVSLNPIDLVVGKVSVAYVSGTLVADQIRGNTISLRGSLVMAAFPRNL